VLATTPLMNWRLMPTDRSLRFAGDDLLRILETPKFGSAGVALHLLCDGRGWAGRPSTRGFAPGDGGDALTVCGKNHLDSIVSSKCCGHAAEARPKHSSAQWLCLGFAWF
jgi:hypothetical protein